MTGEAVIYQVSSSKVRIERWYESREEAIAAFERKCKRLGLTPPLSYPPGQSGDAVSDNLTTYTRRTCATGVRNGHGFVFVQKRNKVQ
jgi:hypothetical protein